MSAVEVHHVVNGREDAPVVVLSNSMGADLLREAIDGRTGQ